MKLLENCLIKVNLDKKGHKKTILAPTPNFHFLLFFFFLLLKSFYMGKQTVQLEVPPQCVMGVILRAPPPYSHFSVIHSQARLLLSHFSDYTFSPNT